MVEYSTLKLPVSFKDKFEELNKKYTLGYASFPEMVKEQLRKRFEEIEAAYRKE